MAVFSRRAIQQWLHENLTDIGFEATHAQVQRLNDRKNPRNVIAAVWEVAIIRALRELGTIEHERKVGDGPRRPDVFFRSQDQRLEFLIDIATASDDGLHDRNWVTELYLGIFRLKMKHGIGHLGIRTEVGQISDGPYGDSIERAALPSKQGRAQFLKNHFTPFIQLIASDQTAKRTLEIKQDGVEVRAIYDPQNSQFGGGSYPSYTTAYSLTNNPIFKSLSEKRKQLKGSGFGGICGVILCDGGCEILHRSGYVGPQAYTLDSIVRHFLQSTHSVNFVLTLGHETHTGIALLNQHAHKVVPRLFLGHGLEEREAEFQILLGIPNVLPSPVETPANAFPKYVQGVKPRPMPSQEYRVCGTKVAIDVGDLIGILGGAINQNDWLHERDFCPNPTPFDQIPKHLTTAASVLNRMYGEGRQLVGVRILERKNNDHDLIEFEFGEIDPARGLFRVPNDKIEPN